MRLAGQIIIFISSINSFQERPLSFVLLWNYSTTHLISNSSAVGERVYAPVDASRLQSFPGADYTNREQFYRRFIMKWTREFKTQLERQKVNIILYVLRWAEAQKRRGGALSIQTQENLLDQII